MKLLKKYYNAYIKRNDLNSSLANHLKNGQISYFEILDDNNNYLDDFVVYDNQNNWLAINIHDKISIIDNKNLIEFILRELKKYYDYVILIISEEFKDRIKKAKELGFKEMQKEKQGKFNYLKLKKELW